MIRRAIALLLMLSFCCFALETAVADVHDGDASADEVARLVGGALPGSTSDGGGAPDVPERASGHLHVCHCSHAHGTLSMMSVASPAGQPRRERPIGIKAVLPAAVDLEVRVRPPIA